MWSASMPGAASSSAVVPEPGSSRTARWVNVQRRRPGREQGVGDRRAEAALGMVVLDHHEPAVGRVRRGD